MSTGLQNDSHCPKQCHLSCTSVASTPFKITPLAALGPGKPRAEIHTFFTGVCMRTPIHIFCFKNGRNWCRISGQKAVSVAWQKKTKHVSAFLGRTPGAISPNFCVSAKHGPSFIFKVSSRSNQVWGNYNQTPLCNPQSDCNIGSLSQQQENN